ncbi:MAG TPA: Coq4 family protein [Polyangiaceae bacterium]
MNPLKTLKMLKSFWSLSQDPNRLSEVFAIADRGSNLKILTEVAKFVSKDPQGARALREGTRLGKLDLKELQKLPVGTLGREFADHMIANGLDPAAIPVPDHHAGDVRYIKTHMRETHDVWHVVTGFHTDVAGEIGLQAFYLAQLPSRLSAVLISMAFLHLATKNIAARDAIMTETMRGWALGKKAKPFFGFDWAAHWDVPLTEVRAMLGVDTALHATEIPDTQTYVFESAA